MFLLCKKNLVIIIGLFLVFLFSSSVQSTEQDFDYQKIERSIQDLSKATDNFTAREQVQTANSQLDEYINQLKTCETEASQSLLNLTGIIGEAKETTSEQKTTSRNLSANIEKLEQRIIECKYLLLVARQLKDKLLAQASKITKQDYFKRIPFYWADNSQIEPHQPGKKVLYYTSAIAMLLIVIALLQLVLRSSGWRDSLYANLFFPIFCLSSIITAVAFLKSQLGVEQSLIWLVFTGVLITAFRLESPANSAVIETMSLAVMAFTSTIVIVGLGLYESVIFHSLVVIGLAVSLIVLLRTRIKGLVKYLAFLVIALGLVLEFLDFHIMAHQILVAVTTMLVIVYFFFLVKELLASIGSLLNQTILTQYRYTQQTNAQSPGIIWIYYAVFAFILSLFIYYMVPLVGFPLEIVSMIHEILTNEINIGTISVAFNNLIFAFLIFGLVLYISHIVKLQIEGGLANSLSPKESAQTAKASLFWYSAVLTASLIALAVAGFNIQNLAIIAGAFSVGIGFGLQTIVSNFVSGLILLIERPVKPGDWIVIGNTEGLVQKISIRATQITTFDRADILVPNSELISNQVTNLMLGDDVGRLKFMVGVAYGTDTEFVAKLMYQTIVLHEEIISDNHELMPSVVLQKFGDSSVDFEVRCFLKDIKKIVNVRSDLLHAIYKQFKEKNIEIPFPKRDVYIKQHVDKG
ncbi:mechanosensitive ion channel [Aliikangiella marina]|uniref:Mechanosensitive ion channel n=1 Tax=Aliikangiella marina TaxID=1712262 RepID=A0A545TE96_9GAMM|nr:mechanosensitive ion channel domain-containing protein [Aliikangiella marina]TQV75555.1 mechanosensitive ion channel [Aliikangiella marina]